MTDLLDTVVGPATVLHRLALAVECRDALSDRPIGGRLQVRWRRLRTLTNPAPAWQLLPSRGTGQYVIEHPLPDNPARPLPWLQLLVDDSTRRYVPRAFTVRPWSHAQVAEPAPYVRALARLVRVWLLPGSAYAFPGNATVIRGRVGRGGKPVRWARVEGRTPAGTAGWAHADDRGEFVLPVLDPGYDPVRDSRLAQQVTLVVSGQRSPVPVDPEDRTADLLSEVIVRSGNPPTSAQLDNDVLRGEAVPRSYVGNRTVALQATVEIGRAFHLTEDAVFDPQP